MFFMKLLQTLTGAALMWGAFLLSHTVAYIVAFPNPAARAHELSHSGHGWLATGVHYGLPVMLAILAVSSVSSKKNDRGNTATSRGLAFASGGAFAFIEVLERVIHSLTTAHAFALSYQTLVVGTALAALFGWLISGMFHEFSHFVVSKILAPSISFISTPLVPKAAFSHAYVGPSRTEQLAGKILPRRGPPAFSFS